MTIPFTTPLHPSEVLSDLLNAPTMVPFRTRGLKGNGSDETQGLQAVINDAAEASISMGSPIAVDLRGRTYGIGSELTLGYAPYGVYFLGGRINALGTFPTNQYMLRTGNTTLTDVAGEKSENVQLFGTVFDANQRGGCLKLEYANRPKVLGCEFWHYANNMAGLQTITDGHELRVHACNFGQYYLNEYAGAASTFTGTGLDLNTHDNLITDSIFQLSAIGIRNNSTFNLFKGCHVWTGMDTAPSFQTKGIYCTASGIKATFVGCYIDSCQVQLDTPFQVTFDDCVCLVNTTDGTFSFFRLKPLVANASMRGVNIINTLFHNNNATLVNAVTVDTSAGSLSATGIRRCDIGRGCEFSNVNPAYSRFKLPVALAAAAAGSADFSSYMPVGAPQHALVSLQAAAGTPAVVVSGIAGKVVSIATSAVVTGTAWVEADINTYP